jgi:rhamnose transport system substrate-binding protein
VWALVQLAEGNKFAASNTVPGFDKPVMYDSATGTLLLGKPTVFNKANYADFDF